MDCERTTESWVFYHQTGSFRLRVNIWLSVPKIRVSIDSVLFCCFWWRNRLFRYRNLKLRCELLRSYMYCQFLSIVFSFSSVYFPSVWHFRPLRDIVLELHVPPLNFMLPYLYNYVSNVILKLFITEMSTGCWHGIKRTI